MLTCYEAGFARYSLTANDYTTDSKICQMVFLYMFISVLCIKLLLYYSEKNSNILLVQKIVGEIMFKEITARELDENLIKKISEEWMLITAGDKSDYNMMTASWGFLGEMWGSDTAVAVIRPQRYTMEFVEREDYFSLSFYGNNKAIHSICGSKSGRDVNKTELAGLTPVFDKAPYFKEANTVIICKKQYVQRMEKKFFVDNEPDTKWYSDGDYHYMVFGKIEKVLVK